MLIRELSFTRGAKLSRRMDLRPSPPHFFGLVTTFHETIHFFISKAVLPQWNLLILRSVSFQGHELFVVVDLGVLVRDVQITYKVRNEKYI